MIKIYDVVEDSDLNKLQPNVVYVFIPDDDNNADEHIRWILEFNYDEELTQGGVTFLPVRNSSMDEYAKKIAEQSTAMHSFCKPSLISRIDMGRNEEPGACLLYTGLIISWSRNGVKRDIKNYVDNLYKINRRPYYEIEMSYAQAIAEGDNPFSWFNELIRSAAKSKRSQFMNSDSDNPSIDIRKKTRTRKNGPLYDIYVYDGESMSNLPLSPAPFVFLVFMLLARYTKNPYLQNLPKHIFSHPEDEIPNIIRFTEKLGAAILATNGAALAKKYLFGINSNYDPNRGRAISEARKELNTDNTIFPKIERNDPSYQLNVSNIGLPEELQKLSQELETAYVEDFIIQRWSPIIE